MDMIKILKESQQPDYIPIKSIQINWKTEAQFIAHLTSKYEKNFVFNQNNKIIYKILLKYFTGDKSFELMNFPVMIQKGSLKKGIFLAGNVGSGKSLIIKNIFKDYTQNRLYLNSYNIFDYRDIKLEYEQYGAAALEKFTNKISNSGGIRRNQTQVILIDDFLATGAEVVYYGNKINLADELVQIRYEVYKRSGRLTHFTTNIFPAQMQEFLDERSLSRLSEMCNAIVFKDKDWRKDK